MTTPALNPQPLIRIPDRKVWAGGIAGIVSWIILSIAARQGITLPVDQATLAGIVGWVVSYFTPPSARDIMKRLNDDLVKAAQDDPKFPAVTKPQPKG